MYPQQSWEDLEGTFLGLMAYLNPKGAGDSSMPVKRRSGPGIRDDASWDPRDMAKAGLPEPQSPGDAKIHPSERCLKPMPCPALMLAFHWRNLRGVERFPAREFKEMSEAPKSR